MDNKNYFKQLIAQKDDERKKELQNKLSYYLNNGTLKGVQTHYIASTLKSKKTTKVTITIDIVVNGDIMT